MTAWTLPTGRVTGLYVANLAAQLSVECKEACASMKALTIDRINLT